MNVSMAAGVVALALTSAASAAIQVPAIISDNMVLQRSDKTPLWGTADAGEKISVKFNGVTAETVADDKGNWRVDLDLTSMKDNGPFDLTIAGNNTITVQNVLVGEVWLCSGQSNMEWGLAATDDAEKVIAAANYPEIRHFAVAKAVENEPQKSLRGEWVVASPDTVGSFTAVGYHFGLEIHQKTGQPVGLINSSWGGTDAESWTSDTQLEKVERYRNSIKQRNTTLQEGGMEKYEADMKAWTAAHVPNANDSDAAKRWAAADVPAADWKEMKLPTMWQQAGLDINGIVWFRKEIELPAAAAGKAASLSLGGIDDCDVTYVNGNRVGATGVETDNFWEHPRNYEVPAGLLKQGRNVITVRVADIGGAGGFGGPAGKMRLTMGEESVRLDGPWKYNVEQVIDFSKLPPRPPMPQPKNPNQAAVLYNGMIAPLVPYALRGAIWYQGENNSGRPDHYAELMTLLIDGWRNDFGRGDFPFYIVQLANFMARNEQPTDTNWARLRDAQRQVTKTVPNTGLAVTIDIGDEKDIHPRNKRDVGKRLAAIALAKDYGKNTEYAGPTFESLSVMGNKLHVRFSHADGLTTGGGAPQEFAIAGEDGKFVWADATIQGNTVILSAKGVESPTQVRYAWGDNPAVNLKNAAGFPAEPFKASK